MENFALQKGPCNFLKLRKGPWEILFPFLLCFSTLYSFLSGSFLLHRQHSPFLIHPIPSLSPLHGHRCRRRAWRRLRPGSGERSRAAGAAAAAGAGARGSAQLGRLRAARGSARPPGERRRASPKQAGALPVGERQRSGAGEPEAVAAPVRCAWAAAAQRSGGWREPSGRRAECASERRQNGSGGGAEGRAAQACWSRRRVRWVWTEVSGKGLAA
jgi:hypothetical protein